MNPTDPAAPLLAFAFLAVAGTAIALVCLTVKTLMNMRRGR